MDRNVSEYTKGLVSIIIPTHNREDMICETLDSVKNQTYKDIEVLVVDDHSEDKTKEVIREYILNHSELKVLLFENDGKGACAARNKGIRESKGEYLQFFDDDDLMFEHHIERKVKAIEEGEYDYAACDFSYFDNETGECVGHKVISAVEHNCVSHLLTQSFPCPCYMFKRRTIEKMGLWDERIKRLQDMVYFQRLFLLDMKGTYLKDELFDVRRHNGSITSHCAASPEGYYAQFFSYDVIDGEWATSGKDERTTVHKTILLLKYAVARRMFRNGFKKQGAVLIMKTFFKNILSSVNLLIFIYKYRTIRPR